MSGNGGNGKIGCEAGAVRKIRTPFDEETIAGRHNIEVFPTHIAGLPVAVNMGCHATRHAEVIL